MSHRVATDNMEEVTIFIDNRCWKFISLSFLYIAFPPLSFHFPLSILLYPHIILAVILLSFTNKSEEFSLSSLVLYLLFLSLPSFPIFSHLFLGELSCFWNIISFISPSPSLLFLSSGSLVSLSLSCSEGRRKICPQFYRGQIFSLFFRDMGTCCCLKKGPIGKTLFIGL